MMDLISTVFEELDTRLKISVNGVLPEIVKMELPEVLKDLNIQLIQTPVNMESIDFNTLHQLLNSYSSSEKSVDVDLYTFFRHLISNGWCIIPPR